MERLFFIGNWGFHPAPKGVSIFSYDDEKVEFRLLKTVRSDIAAGNLCLDAERGVLYAGNECGDRKNEYGGGGSLVTFRIDKEGKDLIQIGERDSLCPEPSYLCASKDGKYILACHCADPWHVTKIVRNEDGTLTNQVIFDDAAVVAFRKNEDESIGDAVDYLTWPGENKLDERHMVMVDPVSNHIQLTEIISRLHIVKASPDGKMFITCDKGMDRIHAFKMDGQGRLTATDTYQADWRSFPRYAVFHPTKNIMYTNSEFSSQVYIFTYDSEEGKLFYKATVSATGAEELFADGKPVGCQDIQIDENGRNLYVTLSGINEITTFHLDDEGMPEYAGRVNCQGIFPRGLAFTPDNKYLISGNMLSGDITVFAIGEDGVPEYTGKKFEAVSPSQMVFY